MSGNEQREGRPCSASEKLAAMGGGEKWAKSWKELSDQDKHVHALWCLGWGYKTISRSMANLSENGVRTTIERIKEAGIPVLKHDEIIELRASLLDGMAQWVLSYITEDKLADAKPKELAETCIKLQGAAETMRSRKAGTDKQKLPDPKDL